MAIVRPGALISALSGVLGNVTFSNTKRGTVASARPLKIRKTSALVIDNQARWQDLRREWYQLTDAERLNWSTVAKNFTYSDRLGVKRTYTGLELFMKHWTINYNFWGAPLGVPPASGTSPAPLRFEIDNFTSSDITVQILQASGLTSGAAWVYGQRMFTEQPFNPPPSMQRVQLVYFATNPTLRNITAAFYNLYGEPEYNEGICLRCIMIYPDRWASPISAPAVAYRL